jgi:hypothetical protein
MSDSLETDDPQARDLLAEAARAIRWSIPDGATLAQLEAACMKKVAGIHGGQDRSHAKNGIRSAVRYAREGNAEYVRAGLWEAKKVLELHSYDKRAAKLEGAVPATPETK